MWFERWALTGVASAAILLAGCGGGEQQPGTDTSPATPSNATSAAAGEQVPDPGKKVIEVEMLTDDQGNNIFRPANVDASRGDVVRYKLVTGVHNVNFLPDSNPGAVGLPPASALLQLPGQTADVKVSFAPGSYYFQCDPHALLGMVGRLKVRE